MFDIKFFNEIFQLSIITIFSNKSTLIFLLLQMRFFISGYSLRISPFFIMLFLMLFDECLDLFGMC